MHARSVARRENELDHRANHFVEQDRDLAVLTDVVFIEANRKVAAAQAAQGADQTKAVEGSFRLWRMFVPAKLLGAVRAALYRPGS